MRLISFFYLGVQRTTMLRRATEAARFEFYHSGQVKQVSYFDLIVVQLSNQLSRNKANSKKDNFAYHQAVSTISIFQQSHGPPSAEFYPCPCHFDGVDNVALPGTLTI